MRKSKVPAAFTEYAKLVYQLFRTGLISVEAKTKLIEWGVRWFVQENEKED